MIYVECYLTPRYNNTGGQRNCFKDYNFICMKIYANTETSQYSVTILLKKTWNFTTKTTGKPIKWILCFSSVLLRVFFDKKAII